MNADEWAEARLLAAKARDPIMGRYLLTVPTAPPFTPPRAGQWVLDHYGHPTYRGSVLYDDGRATAKWHLFVGDLVWGLRWDGPAVVTACGYTTGTFGFYGPDLHARDDRPEDACGNCLRRVR